MNNEEEEKEKQWLGKEQIYSLMNYKA